MLPDTWRLTQFDAVSRKQLKRRIIPFVSTLGPAIVTLRREPGTAISLLRREIKYGMRVIVDQQRSLAVINRPADLHAGGFVFVRNVRHVVDMQCILNRVAFSRCVQRVEIAGIFVVFEYDNVSSCLRSASVTEPWPTCSSDSAVRYFGIGYSFTG